ncbi:indole-3-glycerol phosphate synthase TrpC [Bacteroides sedimenti]|uniref:Indole-3-glycerol phosphate synthase n=1 Tax=Bacteroides sedimenti TaxID=2136147 RepID=A0ABN6Z2J0_9BACE
MKDILMEIIESKRITLREQKKAVPAQLLENGASEERKMFSMRRALANSSTGIIAEFKRKSPSKGWINRDASPEEVTAAYQANGASALSILTDTPYFGGDLKDLRIARPEVNIPILRKDFIIDEYQLYQAKIIGADAVLLIAAALEKDECLQLAEKAHELGLEVLLEIHSEKELEYVDSAIDMVGVNNRNLGTFVTDVENSFRLASMLPKDMLLVSESGISSPETVKNLRQAGFRGFLIGENFMKTSNPGEALGSFIKQLN